jgi:hypothetical protein
MTNTTYRGHRASEKNRCKACKCFIPENRERVMCANCGRPNRQYVE